MSERCACQLVSQPRGTQRYQPTQWEDEDRLTRAIIVLASQYGRYGYRRITALLHRAGWRVGEDRVKRISTPRNLASRRAESTEEAEAKRTFVAQRWVLAA
jgi:transposase InsO family protein